MNPRILSHVASYDVVSGISWPYRFRFHRRRALAIVAAAHVNGLAHVQRPATPTAAAVALRAAVLLEHEGHVLAQALLSAPPPLVHAQD